MGAVVGGLGAHRYDLGRGRAQGRVLDQAAGDDLAQLAGELGEVGLLVECAGGEGREADGRVGGELAEGEDVGGRDGCLVRCLLRGGERGDAGRIRSGAGDAVTGHARPVRGQQHRAGAEPGVHDPGVVDGAQRLGDACDHAQHDGHGKRPPGVGDGRVQGERGHIRGGEPVARTVVAAAEHGHGVRPVHPPHRLHVVFEGRGEAGPGGQLGAYRGEGDGPAVGRVGEVDRAEGADAEPGGDAVAADDSRVVRGGRLVEPPGVPRVPGVLSAHQSPFLGPTRTC
ncbi:hypothetical protein NYE86_24530 [Actinacidiphila bryophytorum]|nr:hypothetical protein [Actinacidiphila bryophytorum]UWE11567.1 hypothetical protein NYE86_24530 [Actinacidiphila bryophytorum]